MIQKSMDLQYEPSSEPPHISVKVPPSHPRKCKSLIALWAMQVTTQTMTSMALLCSIFFVVRQGPFYSTKGGATDPRTRWGATGVPLS